MKKWDDRKKLNVTCENCNKKFEKTLSEYNRSEKLNRKHFCSLNCSKTFKKPEDKRCLNCNNKFTPKYRNNKFCSQSCSVSFNNKNRVGEKRHFSEQAKLNIRKTLYKRLNLDYVYENYDENPRYCNECGNKLEYKKRNNKFCNIKCKRKSDSKRLNEYQKYKKECEFKFNLSDYPDEFNFLLIEEYGWYKAKNRGNNINGVSRDHMISINYGYNNNIDPKIISHPANCELMRHTENIKKNYRNSISLDELIIKIERWNKKYNI